MGRGRAGRGRRGRTGRRGSGAGGWDGVVLFCLGGFGGRVGVVRNAIVCVASSEMGVIVGGGRLEVRFLRRCILLLWTIVIVCVLWR